MVTFAFDKWPVRENKLCEKLVFPGVFLKVNFFVFLLVQQVEWVKVKWKNIIYISV